MIHTVGLILNKKKADAVRYAEKAKAFLKEKDVYAFDVQHNPQEIIPDLIVTFGGDGTLLNGARYAMEYDIPLLGINLGTVGFLTEEEPKQLEKALQAIISGKYQTESRSLLKIGNPKTGETFFALNDAVITRGGYARLIRVEAYINQKKYGVFTADGMIVATPTDCGTRNELHDHHTGLRAQYAALSLYCFGQSKDQAAVKARTGTDGGTAGGRAEPGDAGGRR